MQMIIDYLKENPKYTVIFIVTIFACIVAIVAMVLIRKSITKMQIENMQKNEKRRQEEEAKNKPAPSIFDNLPKGFEKSDDLPANPEKTVFEAEDEQATTASPAQDCPANPTPSALERKQDDKSSKEESQIKEFVKNVDSPQSEPQTQEEVKYAGKWLIYKENDRYYADLKASNGEVMLSSEGYTSLSGIKSGIETLKKNIASENYAINLDKNGNYVFKIFSTANRLLCIGEGYSSKDQCEKAFASVKRFARTANIVNAIEKENA